MDIPETGLNAQEAAEFLGVSVSFIRKAKQENRVAYTQIGARYTFEKSDLLKLVKRVSVEPHNNEPELSLD